MSTRLLSFASALLTTTLTLVSPLANADEVRYLARPQESLIAFYQIFAQAKTSIDVATFIFEPCHASTQVLMDLLAQKAREGVRVRILLDNFQQSSHQAQNIANDFARSGIELRLFNTSIAPVINFRMHSKFALVDGKTYITGGRNLADQYFGVSSSHNYVDRDVMITGESAKSAAKHFEELWNIYLTAKAPGHSSSYVAWNQFCATDGKATAKTLKKRIQTYINTQSESVLASIPARSCANVRFMSDYPDFANAKYADGEDFMSPERLRLKRTTSYILKFIEGTRRVLDAENYIYVPISRLADSIASVRERGAKVRVITNQDMEDGPQFFREAEEYAIQMISARDAIGTQSVQLISSQGELSAAFDLTPKSDGYFLHGKVLVRDMKDVVVGSFNLDSRSYSTNIEAAAAITNCPALASDVKSRIDDLHEAFAHDQKNPHLPPPPQPGLAAILFATMNLDQF